MTKRFTEFQRRVLVALAYDGAEIRVFRTHGQAWLWWSGGRGWRLHRRTLDSLLACEWLERKGEDAGASAIYGLHPRITVEPLPAPDDEPPARREGEGEGGA